MTPDPATRPCEFLEHLFAVAVARALPLHNTARFLPAVPTGRTIVLGAGKAGGSMAQAVEALWPADAPLDGLVVTRYGHTPPRPPACGSASRSSRHRTPSRTLRGWLPRSASCQWQRA